MDNEAFADGYLAVADSRTGDPGECPFPSGTSDAESWYAGVAQRHMENAEEQARADAYAESG